MSDDPSPRPGSASPRPNPRPRPRHRWLGRCGKTIAAAFLLLLAAVAYLNQIGVPDVVKNALTSELRDRGFNVDFRRMRLRLGRGIVAENVQVSATHRPDLPAIAALQAQLKVDWSALLLHAQLKASALRIRGGTAMVALSPPHLPPEPVTVTNIDARLLLLSRDAWHLEHFDADALGISLHARAHITNASAWSRPRRERPPDRSWLNTAARVIATLKTNPPAPRTSLTASATIDALKPADTRLRLDASIPRALVRDTTIDGGNVTLDVGPLPGQAHRIAATLQVHAHSLLAASHPWSVTNVVASASTLLDLPTFTPGEVNWQASARQTSLPLPRETAHLTISALELQGLTLPASSSSPARLRTRVQATATGLSSHPFTTPGITLSLDALHSATNWSDLEIVLGIRDATSPWAAAANTHAHARLRHLPPSPSQTPPPPPLEAAAPVSLSLTLAADTARIQDLSVERLDTSIEWSHPQLTLERLDLRSPAGWLATTGRLDVLSRDARAGIATSLDPHHVTRLLGTNVPAWLADVRWHTNPATRISAHARASLPEPSVPASQWAATILPTLECIGSIDVAHASFRTVPLRQISSRLSCTNQAWTIDGSRMVHDDGHVLLSAHGNLASRDFEASLGILLHPAALRPLLNESALRRLDRNFSGTSPVRIEGTLGGRFDAPEQIHARGLVAATNLTVRGEAVDSVHGAFAFTNRILELTSVRITHGPEVLESRRVIYEPERQSLAFTHCTSTMDIGRITRAVGPKTAQALLPYHFETPPRVLLNGILPTHDSGPMNARFEVDADNFSWWRFAITNTTATVLATRTSVTVSNLVSRFYGGSLMADIVVDTSPREGSITRFEAGFTNAELRAVLVDLGFKTNRMDGEISGRINIDSALSWDTNSWTGHGQMTLTNGFLWGVPMFGVFTPILNSIGPGWGESRFTRGDAHFIVTNSVIRTGDLSVYSPSSVLRYSGTVDLLGRIDATMAAEVTSQTPLFGPVFSIALNPFSRLFEYKVTGTLARPETRPVHVPRLLLAPFHPLRTLRGLFSDRDSSSPPQPPTPATPRKTETPP